MSDSLQKLELLPLSRKVYVMTLLSLFFALTLTGIAVMPVLHVWLSPEFPLLALVPIFTMQLQAWVLITSSILWRGHFRKKAQLAAMFITFQLFVKSQLNSWGGESGVTLGFHYNIHSNVHSWSLMQACV